MLHLRLVVRLVLKFITFRVVIAFSGDTEEEVPTLCCHFSMQQYKKLLRDDYGSQPGDFRSPFLFQ